MRPELLMLESMPREVEHAGTKQSMQSWWQLDKPRNPSFSHHSPWIILKTVLYPLTVMYIPVNYQHPVKHAKGEDWCSRFRHNRHAGENLCHLFTACFCCAYRAAIATLLKIQKPQAALRMLWCPGGLRKKLHQFRFSYLSYLIYADGKSCIHISTASPDQGHAIPHLPHHNTVHKLQCGSYGQLGTVIDVLGEFIRVLISDNTQTTRELSSEWRHNRSNWAAKNMKCRTDRVEVDVTILQGELHQVLQAHVRGRLHCFEVFLTVESSRVRADDRFKLLIPSPRPEFTGVFLSTYLWTSRISASVASRTGTETQRPARPLSTKAPWLTVSRSGTSILHAGLGNDVHV